MKKHKCKLCFRNFSNGRALGGHMRSHMMKFALPPTQVKSPPTQIRDGVGSASSSEDEEGQGGEKILSYRMTENPKRTIRILDLQMEAVEAGSVVLQDRESETESSKNPTRRRSRRIITNSVTLEEDHPDTVKKLRTLINPTNIAEPFAEPEPGSSVSDATEEDVAFCLMMLSRDKWKSQRDQVEEDNENADQDYNEDEDEEVEEDDEALRSSESSENSEERKPTKNRVRGKYKCETCNKFFRSYQALGGHRASHKNIRLCTRVNKKELEKGSAGTSVSVAEKKTHECPVCFRTFSSGQALGGHKRIHVICTSATSEPIRSSTKFEDRLIDLNRPAPIEDDEVSQNELSAVSDAEFQNPIRQ